MKASTRWMTYRTRFLVNAKQLAASLSFTDVLGRQHSGRKGDYLVESSDGVLRIAPRQIFEDIYVALLPNETRSSEKPLSFRAEECGSARPTIETLSFRAQQRRSQKPTIETLSFRVQQHRSRSEGCCGVEEPAVLPAAPPTVPRKRLLPPQQALAQSWKSDASAPRKKHNFVRASAPVSPITNPTTSFMNGR
jgi:hypothetical protein